MANRIKPVSMDSDTFTQLKQDMTKSLNKLLYHMQKYGAEKAAMTAKLTVTLDRNSGLADGDVPRFEHKVTATVQRKDDVSGQLSGEYVLEEDGKGGYQLKTLIGQASMFESKD